MSKKKNIEYLIIGAGPTGICAATYLVKAGKQVTLVGNVIGGSCSSNGTCASQTLHKISRLYEGYRRINDVYIANNQENPALDFKKIKKTVDQNLNKVKKVFQDILDNDDITLIEGVASFTGKNSIKIKMNDETEEEYTFTKCLVATGSLIQKSNVYSKKLPGDLSTFVTMENIPESVTIVGAGLLGVEISSFYQRLGCKVTLVDKNERILSKIDPFIAKKFEDTIKKRGINIVTNFKMVKVEKVGQKYFALSEEESIESEEIYLCTGRVSAISELMLENAGVTLKNGDFVEYNNHLQTSNENIYIAGDASTVFMNVNWSYYTADIAVRNMIGQQTALIQSHLPVYVNSEPAIALIGITEEEAKAEGFECGIIKYTYNEVYGYTLISGQSTVIKLVYDKENKTFLGVQAIGYGSKDIVEIFAMIINLNVNVENISYMSYINPLFSDFFNEVFEKIL